MSDCTAKLGPDTFLKGKLVQLQGSDKNVNAFLGIPYAQPPVGELRFKRPVPAATWTGSRDALEFGPISTQENGMLMKIMMGDFAFPTTDEDCLYLNVWTPTLEENANLPVMVWIHGGGFSNGCSNYHNGIALANKQNVVFVSINYRLGPFGFMCLGDDLAPGNMGLLDQVEALKWIKSNIKAFGGDPENITLFGQSAGAISVGCHTVSKLSADLFHKAIFESGPALHPMWVHKPEYAKAQLMGRIEALGFKGSTSEDVIKWFESKEPSWIATSLSSGFMPVLDDYFLHDFPQNLYAKGDYTKVPMILGFNSHEGAMFTVMDPRKGQLDSIEDAKNHIKPAITMMFYRGYKNAEKVFDAVWDFYIGEETDLEEISKRIVAYLGDLMFVAPSILAAEIHTEYSPTYIYNYTHRWSKSFYPEWIQAAHLQEIDMVIGKPLFDENQENWTEEERQLSELIMSYWANFARKGDPNGEDLPEWPRYEKESKKLLHLQTKPETQADHNPKAMYFWNFTVPTILAADGDES